MKLILTKSINDGQIIDKDLLDPYGNILLKKGTILSKEFIPKLKNQGIYYLYIKDEEYNEETEDIKLLELKQSLLDSVPDIFNKLLLGQKLYVMDKFEIVDDIVEHIVEKGDINANLNDMKEYDNYTFVHCVNTCIMATFMGLQLNMSIEELKKLARGALLHDIGNMKLPLQLLNKSESITENEKVEIRKHPMYGYKILTDAGITDKEIMCCVLEHHERVDGTGYPFRKKANEISIYGKVLGLCGVYTALLANRSFRRKFYPNDAYECVMGGVNSMFDANVAEIFKENFAIYPVGSYVQLSNGNEGYIIRQNKGFPDRPVLRVTYDNSAGKSIIEHIINLLYNTNLTITALIE